jgi:hypothetical protein
VSVAGRATVGTVYDYVALSRPPRIENVDPLAGSTAGGTVVLITGTAFRVGGSVYFVDPVTNATSECVWRDAPGMFYTDNQIR